MRLKKIFKFSSANQPMALGGHYNLDLHVGHVIKAYDIDTIVDVGANEGQFGTSMRRLAFGGDIYSFEPVKAVYDILAQTAAGDSRWKTYNLALGDANNETQINVSEASVFSSVLEGNEFGAKRFEGIKVDRKENIMMRRLDEFLGREMSGRRVLLKMDTQGYDVKVFEGAAGILPHVCALISELSLIPIYYGMKHYREALEIYEKGGFSVSGVYPVSRNKKNLSLIEIDCVMVNQKLYEGA
jgi:FkbM family methyltransferase